MSVAYFPINAILDSAARKHGESLDHGLGDGLGERVATGLLYVGVGIASGLMFVGLGLIFAAVISKRS
jgi:hypothetical protein